MIQKTSTYANIDNLPITDPEKARREILDALYALRHRTVTIEERLSTLNGYQKPIHFLCHTQLEDLFKHPNAVPYETFCKTIEKCRSLRMSLVNGYKFLIKKILEESLTKSMRGLLAVAIANAIIELTEILVICYQRYVTPPKQLWFELHRLFLYAEEEAVQDTLVHGEKTIYKLYKHALLLAAADLPRLAPNDILTVHQQLNQWAGEAELTEYGEDGDLFLVRFDKDSAPEYTTPPNLSEMALNHDARVLHTVNLVSHLRNALILKEDSDQSTTLLKHLIAAWGTTHVRHTPRRQRQEPVQVAIGLAATHAMLNIGQEQEIEPLQNTALAHIAGPESHNLETKYPLQEWALIDSSAGGYCLKLSDVPKTTLLPDEIIGVKETDGLWRIGNIRWVHYNNDSHVLIGIQLMSAEAQPVWTQLKRKSGTSSAYLSALLMECLTQSGQDRRLVTPSLPGAPSIGANVIHGDARYQVIMLDQTNANRGYQEYSFSKEKDKP